MSYRLITRATLTIVAASGATTTRELDIRAYPAPKREAAGAIVVDGNATVYRRTGGKGRGTIDRRYAYFPYGAAAVSTYIEITEAEAAAMIGGTISVTSIAAPVAAPVAAAPEAPKAPRRVRNQARTPVAA